MDINQTRINQKIAELKETADDYPGVVIVLNIANGIGKVEYISTLGATILGLSMEVIKELGDDYHKRFFNQEDTKEYLPKLNEMIERNNDNVYSFFQQVRRSESYSWEWYFSTMKILLRDDNKKPLLCITFAAPIDSLHHVTHKVSRLLNENNFLRENYKFFSLLTQREKEVLTQISSGKSSRYIAKSLILSLETIKTHRKNIYQKLNIQSAHQLMEFARAFDLV